MIDLITVVYREELPLLQVQAVSISQYATDIGSITVVVNDEDAVAELIDSAWWGQYQSLVRVVCYSKWNYTCRVTGWENQQLCKLLAAAESTAEWAMVLDSKTWFVQPLKSDVLFTDNRVNLGTNKINPVFTASREFVEQHYNVQLSRIIGPAGVPFVFHTQTVTEMIQAESNFIEFFQTNVQMPSFVTEFYLYSGYVLHRFGSYDALYNNHAAYQAINIADWQVNAVDQILTRLRTDPTVLTASIHRNAYSILTTAQLQQWDSFLHSKGLK